MPLLSMFSGIHLGFEKPSLFQEKFLAEIISSKLKKMSKHQQKYT
jgi:hypothetical protein